jgi:hypothetical protein
MPLLPGHIDLRQAADAGECARCPLMPVAESCILLISNNRIIALALALLRALPSNRESSQIISRTRGRNSGWSETARKTSVFLLLGEIKTRSNRRRVLPFR